MCDYFNSIVWDDALLNLDPNDAVFLSYIRSHLIMSYIFVKRIYKMNNSLNGFRLILLKSFIRRRKAHRIRKRTNRYKDYLVCSVYFVSKIITGALSVINGNLLESLAICFRIMILSLESVISNKFLIFFCVVFHTGLCFSTVVCSHFSFNRCIHLSNFGIGIEDIFTICNPKISEGASGIASILFKCCSFMLSRVIWLIFDCSFPDTW